MYFGAVELCSVASRNDGRNVPDNSCNKIRVTAMSNHELCLSTRDTRYSLDEIRNNKIRNNGGPRSCFVPS